jgi:prolyl oligopeptidase
MRHQDYPSARREDVTERRAGASFPDPYRWLESNTDEVRQWQRDQGTLAAGRVRRWPHFEQLKRSVAKFQTLRITEVPRYAAGRWFRTVTRPGATHAVAEVSQSPTEEGRVLFDPALEDVESPPFLSWIAPSPDGRTLALGVCSDGSENNTIRLIDVATGRRLSDAPTQVLMDSWSGGVQWLPNSGGFFFTALTGTAQAFEQAVFLYRIGADRPLLPEPVPFPVGSRDYRMVTVSRDGRWAVAIHGLGTPQPVALRELSNPSSPWRPFVTGASGTIAGHVIGDHYVAVTDVNAPRGRVVAIALNSLAASDPASWEEIVSESEAVIRSLTRVGDQLYTTELVDTYARIRIFSRDGSPAGEVPLPGKGAVSEYPFPMMNIAHENHPEEFIFAFSSLVESWGTYRHRPGANQLETLIEPEVRLDGAIVGDHWATSADGTRVCYHTVRLASLDANRPHPALIYAYGGFNVALVPQFPGAMAAFVAAGGIFVHAHLRGGAEFGLDWWRGGKMQNKQNSYADLYSVAEDLFANKMTQPRLLGVTGGSNGGLMSGVALTQRPKLWRVVIPRVPLFDVIGACRDPYGLYAVTEEFGDPENPDDLRRLAAMSPYHMVKDGVHYPAVFIDAGDTDPRCPAWHSRKFAARLQRAQASEEPILVHIWENVGHGWATAKNVQLEEHTEWLAFAMQQLDMTPEHL